MPDDADAVLEALAELVLSGDVWLHTNPQGQFLAAYRPIEGRGATTLEIPVAAGDETLKGAMQALLELMARYEKPARTD